MMENETNEIKTTCFVCCVCVYMYLLGGCIRQVSEGPEAVLYQSLAGVSQVKSKSLHAACGKKKQRKNI